VKAFLTGIGWVTTQGMGRGRTGAAFEPSAGRIPVFPVGSTFGIRGKRFGRLDTYSKVGLSAIFMALTDAGLAEWTDRRPVGIVAATESGCLQTDMDYFTTVAKHGGKLASPNLFAYTLPNTFIGEAGILFGLSGMGVSVSVPGGAGDAVLCLAMESLTWGEDSAMLAGVCELPPGAPFGPPAGAVPMGAFAVLEKRRREQTVPYGEVTGEKKMFFFNGKKIDTFIELMTLALLTRREML
jgi:3-oxoacyl-[acyl-carrier-protein] synthase II